MPLNQAQCNELNNYLFDRLPNFRKQIEDDRQPWGSTYNGLYASQAWASFKGDTQTYDTMHVARPNDDTCWEEVNVGNLADPCTTTCTPGRKVVGWGSSRDSFGKFHRDYTTMPLCYDKMRDTAEAVYQIGKIMEGLKKMPDNIVSDFTRAYSMRSANVFHIAGSAGLTVTVTPGMFTNQCTRIDLGGTGNLPTSKLTMNYLDNHVEDLFYNGYFRNEFAIDRKFEIMTDIQTWRSLANANPTLAGMYTSADFAKGGSLYRFGVMGGVGNWLFKADETPARFQHLGNGVLERVQPFENEAARIGIKPVFSQAYKNAPYQGHHVYNRGARTAFFGETPSMGDGISFPSRNLNGKWRWMSPDSFQYTDPNNGTVCTMFNDKHNMGYWLAEFELGFQTVYPEIEMWIIAQHEPQSVVNDPKCAATPDVVVQDLKAYPLMCGDS